MLSINLSDMDVAREGGAFELIKPGKHHAYVSSVEVTESKSSGKPMLVVEWTVDGDDTEAGKTVLDRTVFTFKSKRTGKELIHFNLPKYFGAAGQWPSNPAELKAKLSPAQIDSTVQAVEEDLEGVGAMLDIAVDEGRKRFDQNGQPVYKTDENGDPITDESGNPVQDTWNPSNSVKRLTFDPKKTSSAKITLL